MEKFAVIFHMEMTRNVAEKYWRAAKRRFIYRPYLCNWERTEQTERKIVLTSFTPNGSFSSHFFSVESAVEKCREKTRSFDAATKCEKFGARMRSTRLVVNASPAYKLAESNAGLVVIYIWTYNGWPDAHRGCKRMRKLWIVKNVQFENKTMKVRLSSRQAFPTVLLETWKCDSENLQ